MGSHLLEKKPYKLYIEPKPGGGFWEIFNNAGDGARHATVIYAERGKTLRFDGPLGLSGMAVQSVTSYELTPVGADSTKLVVSYHVAGEMPKEMPAMVDGVWHHFILERFRPYVLAHQSGRK